MIDKLVKSEIAQCEQSTLVARSLHFDICTTRLIKSGSKSSLGCLGGNL